MPRDISNDLRTEFEASRSAEFVVIFATITHNDLLDPIRVNNDAIDYVDADGNTLAGFDPTEEAVEAWERRVNRLNLFPELLAEVKRFRDTQAYFLRGGKPSTDEEGKRLERLSLAMLDDLIARATQPTA